MRHESRSGRPKPDGMQNRLDRLENLVATLLSETPSSDLDSPHAERAGPMENGGARFEKDLERTRERLGVMIVEKDNSLYRGTTHWDDVLHEV